MQDTQSEYSFMISGKLPGMNEFINETRTNKYKGADLKKKWQKLIYCEIRRQLKGVRINCPVNLHYHWIEPNKRRDKDNVAGFGHKIIQDALVQAGVLDNDGWANIEGFTDTFEVNKNKPGVLVRIEVLGGEDGKR